MEQGENYIIQVVKFWMKVRESEFETSKIFFLLNLFLTIYLILRIKS